jgi:parallel beta-helix repeat protein
MRGSSFMKQRFFESRCGKFSSPSLRCIHSLILLLFIACPIETSAAAAIDVTSYGAIPNDYADDSLAIQKAIDAAPDNSTIYFPKGTYLLSNVQISYRRGLTISGDGSTLTILRHSGADAPIVASIGSTDMLVTQLGFDVNGVSGFGGFNFYDAKRITIAKTHFFDSTKQSADGYDRYGWNFGPGSVPSDDILLTDNLIEDLQLAFAFALRVRIEGNTVVRPRSTAGIAVVTIDDHTPQNYSIRKNIIVDPVVGAGAIVLHLDPASTYSTTNTFRIVGNQIVYTKNISADHGPAILLEIRDHGQVNGERLVDDIVIRDNIIYKDPGSAYDFYHPVIFGGSSAEADFRFDNLRVSNNRVYYNNTFRIPLIQISRAGKHYTDSNNVTYAISADVMPPSVPTALTPMDISADQVHLSWNASVDNIGLQGYRVYRNRLPYARTTTPSYLDRNVQPGVAYTYTVTAVDTSDLESSHSYSVTARTRAGRPVTTASPTAGQTVTSTLDANATSRRPSGFGTLTKAPRKRAHLSLTASPASVVTGDALTVAWNGIPSPSPRDWIGLYQPSATNGPRLDWFYVSCSKTPGVARASGSCAFVVPTVLAAGPYELRLFANDGSTLLTRSNPFMVTARPEPTSEQPPLLTLKDTNYPIPPGALFVSTSGSDTNLGTEASPLRSIQNAVKKAGSGSTIVIRQGVYRESIGYVDKKLTFQPYPHEQVWIKGSIVVTGWVQDGSIWRKDNWTYKFTPNSDNGYIIDPAYPMAKYVDQAFVDGKPLKQVGSKTEVVGGTFFVNYAANQLFIGDNPAGRTVEGSTIAICMNLGFGSADSVVRGLGFVHFAPNMSLEAGPAAVIGNAQRLTFENNTFAYNSNRGLALWAMDSVVRGNVFIYNGEGGLTGYAAHGTIIEGNYIGYNNTEHFKAGWDANGAKLGTSNGVIWRGNVVEYNFGGGLWCDYQCQDNVFVRNIVRYNGPSHGIFYEVSQGGIIASNVIYGNEGSGIGLSRSSSTKVYNNSLSKNGVNIALDDCSSNITVKNNILSNIKDSSPWANYYSASLYTNCPNTSGDVIIPQLNHNAYYRTSSALPRGLIAWAGYGSYENLPAFQKARNKELNGIATDDQALNPFFLDEANGNYRLKADSPAKNKGEPLPNDVAAAIGTPAAVPVDIGALPRPGSSHNVRSPTPKNP